MFANKEHLRRKTPQKGIARKEYIEHLVEEFYTTTNVEAQEQVTANLANFAYDPINFEFLREAAALDVFLQLLSLPNERLVLHGTAGISNICLDPTSHEEIIKPENIKLLVEVLQSTDHIEIIINLMTLFHLLLSQNLSLRRHICTSNNLQRIRYFKKSPEERLKAIALVFLEDFAARVVEVENNA